MLSKWMVHGDGMSLSPARKVPGMHYSRVSPTKDNIGGEMENKGRR